MLKSMTKNGMKREWIQCQKSIKIMELMIPLANKESWQCQLYRKICIEI